LQRRILTLVSGLILLAALVACTFVLVQKVTENGPPPSPPWFKATKIAAFPTNQSAPGAVTEVPDPHGGGRTVLALTVHNDDVAPVTPTENPRAQLLSPPIIHSGSEFWLATEVLIPRHFPKVRSWLTLCSVYGPPAAGSGPLDIALDQVEGHGEMLMLRRNGSYRYDIPWAVPVPRGRWVKIVWHERFATDGFVELWIDGKQVTFFKRSPYNPLGLEPTDRLKMATEDHSDDDGPNAAKIMQYRERGQFTVGTTYFAGLALGPTRSSVEDL
jgi:hypothetical protein